MKKGTFDLITLALMQTAVHTTYYTHCTMYYKYLSENTLNFIRLTVKSMVCL